MPCSAHEVEIFFGLILITWEVQIWFRDNIGARRDSTDFQHKNIIAKIHKRLNFHKTNKIQNSVGEGVFGLYQNAKLRAEDVTVVAGGVCDGGGIFCCE